jgi:import inner membrane translocase subunit TIM50
MRSRIAHYSV